MIFEGAHPGALGFFWGGGGHVPRPHPPPPPTRIFAPDWKEWVVSSYFREGMVIDAVDIGDVRAIITHIGPLASKVTRYGMYEPAIRALGV